MTGRAIVPSYGVGIIVLSRNVMPPIPSHVDCRVHLEGFSV